MKLQLLKTLLVTSVSLLILVGPAFAGGLQEKIETNKLIQTLVEPIVPTNYASTSAEIEPNNACEEANTYVDVMTGAIDPGGDEDWFWFDGLAGDCVTIATDTWNGSSTDTQLYLYDTAGCSDPLNYLVWNDDAGPGLFSLIEDFALPGSGTYYIRVKHYSSSGTGEYALTLDLASCPVPPEPPVNDLCENAIRVDCNTSVEGSTELGANDLEDILEVCVPFGADGPDVFYEICVPPSHELDVMLTPDGWDPALWFVMDCNDETTCVAGTDAGFFNDPEMLTWINVDEVNEVCIYIVPDSYYSGASGPFTLDINCTFVVPVEGESWGALKANYHD